MRICLTRLRKFLFIPFGNLGFKHYTLRIRYITINYFWMSTLMIYQTAVSLQHWWNARKNYQKLCCLYNRLYAHLNFVSRLSSWWPYHASRSRFLTEGARENVPPVLLFRKKLLKPQRKVGVRMISRPCFQLILLEVMLKRLLLLWVLHFLAVWVA